MQAKQEELGDLPLLGHLIKQTQLISLLDEHFPVHGNWTAPKTGKMVMGWPRNFWSKACSKPLTHKTPC